MKELTGIWEGTLDGTNWGRLLAKLRESSDTVTGFAQIADVGVGTYNFDVQGSRQDEHVTLRLSPAQDSVHDYAGTVQALLTLVSDDEFLGEWQSTIGTYGICRARRQAPRQESPEAMATRVAEANAALVIMALMDRQSGNLPVEDILEAIKRACTKVGLQAHRVDEVEHSGAISAKILDEIKSQRFLISDLTHQRPNVYYEIGYAHGLGKEVILAAQKGTEVHFDIAHLNVIVYNTLKELEDRIVKRLLAKMTAKERQNI